MGENGERGEKKEERKKRGRRRREKMEWKRKEKEELNGKKRRRRWWMNIVGSTFSTLSFSFLLLSLSSTFFINLSAHTFSVGSLARKRFMNCATVS